MEIAAARVATFHYILTDDAGQVLDRSPEDHPLSYFHGGGNIIPGLEKGLEGRSAGESLTVDVPPAEAYGERIEGLVQDVPREAFQGIDRIEPGMQFQANGGQGPVLVTVVAVGDRQVRIDGNHPLAGKTLHFDVRITDVREATDEEKQTGRVAA
ncbi:peptidylprolyl isomerase [Pseudoxanthomonas sp. J31]|uniref:FKBP-type peptidyl-prolyl cis-trans isomerase n=1 Tax=Pseudoxanthomonas sp. J31 TaxID=935851 RepID=UPI000406D07D|nr:peptidylprolyl isomerase [Pseudoxanthomonas sp. J31]